MTANPSGRYLMRVSSSTEETLTVLLEPGLGQVQLPGGTDLEVFVSGPEGETVELTHGPGYVAIWPSPRLSVTVRDSEGSRIQLL